MYSSLLDSRKREKKDSNAKKDSEANSRNNLNRTNYRKSGYKKNCKPGNNRENGQNSIGPLKTIEGNAGKEKNCAKQATGTTNKSHTQSHCTADSRRTI